jgi:predicted dehydrogenase
LENDIGNERRIQEETMLKIGLAGWRAISTLQGFRSAEGVEVTAACELNEDLLAKFKSDYGIPHVYRVFEDMLASDIDAVVIATPMQCHVPQALSALGAGKHVLCEVTAGVTMDELWWLIETVESSGKVYMMAENYCYIPEVQLIKSLVRKGFFGEVYYGEGEYLHDIREMAVYPGGEKTWRYYWQLGTRGAFYPTHSIGPVMQWFGGDRIRSLCTLGSGRHVDARFRQDDTTVTLCQMESGRLARIRVDCISPRPHNLSYYQLQGTKGCYEAPRGMGDGHKIWLEGYDGWRPLEGLREYLPERYLKAGAEQNEAGHGGGDFFIVQDFVDAALRDAKPEIDVYDACEWTAVALLSALSVSGGGRMVDMPEFRKNMPAGEDAAKL